MKRGIIRIFAALLGICIIAGAVPVPGAVSFAAPNNTGTESQENGEAGDGSDTGEDGLAQPPENNSAVTDENANDGSKGGTEEGSGDGGASVDSESAQESSNVDGEDSGAQEQQEQSPADQSGLKENSWRYQEGDLIQTYEITPRSGYPNAWNKVNGFFMNSEGEVIEGATKKGIDVSEHQGKINWDKVKADGIDYAILRVGYGNNTVNQDDAFWQYNVSECERLGIPYGVYIYSYATDTNMANSEAEHVLRLIKGHSFSYPVYFDMEDASTQHTSNDMKGQIAKTFCDKISAAGYKAGIYANLDWWKNHLTSPVFNNPSWSKWVAQYNTTCNYDKPYDMWQYTSKGSVAGINGNVDMNFWMEEGNGQPSDPNTIKNDIISFAAYMQTYAWQEAVHNGEDAGLAGYAKRMEAFKISIGRGYGDLGVKYSALVDGSGWQNYVSNGALAGTTGQGKAVQAVKIELTGNTAANYDIYYRVHAQNYGWMGWTKNGEAAGTEGYGKRLEAVQIKIVHKGGAAPGSTDNAFLKPSAGTTLSYQSYVNGQGWQAAKSDGQTSGTSGQARSLEALKVQAQGAEYSGNVVYNTYMQTYGWQTEASNNAENGLPGSNKRMEAVKIHLTGDIAKHYDIYYRAYVQSYEWLGWAKNGEVAGTSDLAKRLESIQIKLVKKGGAAPGTTENAYKHPLIQYQAHVQTYGWGSTEKDGAISGVTGEGKRLEAIKISLPKQQYSGNVEYKTHVQTYGWQDWKKNGENAGTSGESKRLEAIQIKLTGEMANKYDIYYRVHVQTYGWLDWAKNGEKAGTAGQAKRMEAIQIQLVPKGSAAPGSTDKVYIEK